MTRFLALTALVTLLSLAGPAAAQGTNAPAGDLSAAAPGGTVGRAGPANVRRAIRSGKAVRLGRTRRR